jgi:hypothetical protein
MKGRRPTRIEGVRRAGAQILLVGLALLLAFLPRSAGALVVHAHEGHGLHSHLVGGGADDALDAQRFHARHHEHRDCDGGHDSHAPEDGDLLVGLPSEPVRGAAVALHLPPPEAARATDFGCDQARVLADATSSAVRPRPPRARGRAARSGARRLVSGNAALRH